MGRPKKEDGDDDVRVVEEVKETKVLIRPPKVKTYSFEQWAQIRKKLPRHLAGMRAFLGKNAEFRYPLAKWDAIFNSY